MFLEAFGAAVLGLAIAYGAAAQLPARFANRALVLGTGPTAALLGGVVSRVVLGPGHALVTLAVAAAVSIAILSLLLSDGVGGSGPPRSSGFGASMAGSHRA